MPFVTEYTPISAALKLGSIAGAGNGMAQAQARRISESAQIAAQNLQAKMQAQQMFNEQQARDHSNQIETALAYSRLQQDQGQFQQQLAQKQAETQAQAMYNQQRGTEDTRQFNERQTLDEQKFDYAKNEKVDQEAAVNDMIDQYAPMNTPENQRLKLQFKATGRLPAPQNEDSTARSLNALMIARKSMVDPLGEPIHGKEHQLAQIDQQISALVGSIGGADQTAPAPTGGKVLDEATALQLLNKAGGDKNAARQMAMQMGFTIPS